MAEMHKAFGISERSVRDALNRNKLFNEINILRHRDAIEKTDTNTLASIGSEDDWSKKVNLSPETIKQILNSSPLELNIYFNINK